MTIGLGLAVVAGIVLICLGLVTLFKPLPSLLLDGLGRSVAVVVVGIVVLMTGAVMLSRSMAEVNQAEMAASAIPAPFYAEKDGNIVRYISQISEQQREAGLATPDVVSLRYKGVRDDRVVFDILGPNDVKVGSASCADPCVLIDLEEGGVNRKMGYSPESIFGAAMSDALNGHLDDPAPE